MYLGNLLLSFVLVSFKFVSKTIFFVEMIRACGTMLHHTIIHTIYIINDFFNLLLFKSIPESARVHPVHLCNHRLYCGKLIPCFVARAGLFHSHEIVGLKCQKTPRGNTASFSEIPSSLDPRLVVLTDSSSKRRTLSVTPASS